MLIDVHQNVHGATTTPGKAGTAGFDQAGQARFKRQRIEIREKLAAQASLVLNRQCFGVSVQKKVEGVDGNEIRQQVHLDLQGGRRFGKNQTCLEVPKRILLPIEEMALGRDSQGVPLDGRAGVGRWP